MTRRHFIQRVAGGIIGTAAALHLPGRWVGATAIGRESAVELLRRAWLDYYTVHHLEPTRLIVGHDLYAAFGDELTANARTVSVTPSAADAYQVLLPEYLLFRSGRVHSSDVRGWAITAEGPQRTVRP